MRMSNCLPVMYVHTQRMVMLVNGTLGQSLQFSLSLPVFPQTSSHKASQLLLSLPASLKARCCRSRCSLPPFLKARPPLSLTPEDQTSLPTSTLPLTPSIPESQTSLPPSTLPLIPSIPKGQGSLRPSTLALRSTQLKSTSRCILSVVSPLMQKQVIEFDELRRKVKATKLHSPSTVLVQQYSTASATLKHSLIKEYKECKEILAKSNSTTALTDHSTTKLKHKINVLKRVLSHEWKIRLSD